MAVAKNKFNKGDLVFATAWHNKDGFVGYVESIKFQYSKYMPVQYFIKPIPKTYNGRIHAVTAGEHKMRYLNEMEKMLYEKR